jgi:hypothetical protein
MKRTDQHRRPVHPGRPPSQRRPPAPPPELEQLRLAHKYIDPKGIYLVDYPDGTKLAIPGSVLLQIADETVAVADAVQAGDPAAILAAVERFNELPEVTIFCAPVGSALGIPPGSETEDCCRCGRAIWVTPGTRKHAEGFVPRFVCADCEPPAAA